MPKRYNHDPEGLGPLECSIDLLYILFLIMVCVKVNRSRKGSVPSNNLAIEVLRRKIPWVWYNQVDCIPSKLWQKGVDKVLAQNLEQKIKE